MPKISIIGAGLAGCEAAWQAAQAGIDVELFEMRPLVMTPAHHSGQFAELVCSNSLRAAALENAAGLLKEEMRRQNSIIIRVADECRVPAGGALAVDRQAFSDQITQILSTHPRINIIRQEVTELPDNGLAIIASGPLTSPALSATIGRLTGQQDLYFYDAAAPIVNGESLDMSKIYRASRYGKGSDDYLNCPMTEDEYRHFWNELTTAATVPVKELDKTIFFEGCMPIEEMAGRGIDTLRFGPLKPVGLRHPETQVVPYAVVQLRQDDAAATLYNMVGFQTHLQWPEQQRVFRLIPGMEQAEFLRLGVMHRNTFINSPRLLEPSLQFKTKPTLFCAGQITGVEGYIESAATGLVAGRNAARLASGQEPLVYPSDTAHGALCHYITHADPEHFQPMNITFGLLPPLETRIRDKKQRNLQITERALDKLQKFREKCDDILA